LIEPEPEKKLITPAPQVRPSADLRRDNEGGADWANPLNAPEHYFRSLQLLRGVGIVSFENTSVKKSSQSPRWGVPCRLVNDGVPIDKFENKTYHTRALVDAGDHSSEASISGSGFNVYPAEVETVLNE
jgi:hypothetical protein